MFQTTNQIGFAIAEAILLAAIQAIPLPLDPVDRSHPRGASPTRRDRPMSPVEAVNQAQ